MKTKDAQLIEAKFPVSEAARKRNPHLYPVATDSTDRPESAPLQTLEHGKQGRASGKKNLSGGPILRVELIQFRKKLLDPDAVAFAAKPITDAIAAELGVDDADPRVKWEWTQVQTIGTEGVLVKIEEV